MNQWAMRNPERAAAGEDWLDAHSDLADRRDEPPMTTAAQDSTIAAIRDYHGTATVMRESDGAIKVVVPQDRAFRVMLDGDAVDLDNNQTIPREEIQRYGC